MRCFVVWFYFKTKIREWNPLYDFIAKPKSGSAFLCCVVFLYFLDLFFRFFIFLGFFSCMSGGFYPVSTTAPDLLSGWRGFGSRKGFATFPKDAQSLDLPPISGMLRLIFFSPDISFIFFSFSWLVEAQTALIVPGMLSCTAQVWDLWLPVFPEIPNCSWAPSQANTNTRHTTCAAWSRENIDLTGPAPQTPLISLGHNPSINPFSSENG